MALVQRHRAHQLNIEMTLAQRSSRRVADDRERLRQDVVERLALCEAVAELRGARPQGVVGQRLRPGLERVDLHDDLLQSSELGLVGVEDAPEDAQGSIAR